MVHVQIDHTAELIYLFSVALKVWIHKIGRIKEPCPAIEYQLASLQYTFQQCRESDFTAGRVSSYQPTYTYKALTRPVCKRIQVIYYKRLFEENVATHADDDKENMHRFYYRCFCPNSRSVESPLMFTAIRREIYILQQKLALDFNHTE